MATATPVVLGPEKVAAPPINGESGGIINMMVPNLPPHDDVHASVSPILAGWGPGIAYSRIFRYRWNPADDGRSGPAGLSTQYDPSTSLSSHEITCDICSDWSLDDDGSLRITIRDDVKWQNIDPLNGRSLNSRDVQFSLQRIKDPALPNSHLLNTVSKLETEGASTLVISTFLPDSELWDKLADGRAAIVSPEAVELQGDLKRGPTVGTGPWILGEQNFHSMTFRRNPDYHLPQLPLAEGIKVHIVAGIDAQSTMLRVGLADMGQLNREHLASAIDRFPELRWRTTHDTASGIEVAINTTRAPFNNIEVRQAVMKAWNPAQLIDELHRGQAFLSVGLPLQDSTWLLPNAEIVSYFNDLDAARSLMADQSIDISTPIMVTVGEYGDDYINTAQSLARALTKIGITAEVERVPTRKFGDEVWINGQYDIYVGAAPPQSSVSSLLFSVYHSEAPWNSTGYSSLELDELIEKQTVELNRGQRRELLLELQRKILAGAYRFKAATRVLHWLWWPHLNNVSPNTYRADSFWATRIWLENSAN